MAAGEEVFKVACIACHQATGLGIPGAFPPLAKSDFLLSDPERAVGIVVRGLTGEVTVNNQKFNSVMPAMTQLSEQQIADVLIAPRECHRVREAPDFPKAFGSQVREALTQCMPQTRFIVGLKQGVGSGKWMGRWDDQRLAPYVQRASGSPQNLAEIAPGRIRKRITDRLLSIPVPAQHNSL